MISCAEFAALCKRYLAGETTPDESSLLDGHAKSCGVCRALLDECRRVEKSVPEAFRTKTSPSDAAAATLARLSDGRHVIQRPGMFARLLRPALAAAALVLACAVGFLVGESRGRGARDRETGAPIPWTVAKLEGTVLVRRPLGSAWLEMTPDNSFHVGDEILTLPGSDLTLALEDKASLRIVSNSVVALVEHNGGATVALSRGTVIANFPAGQRPFQVATPSGVIQAHGSNVEVTVNATGTDLYMLAAKEKGPRDAPAGL